MLKKEEKKKNVHAKRHERKMHAKEHEEKKRKSEERNKDSPYFQNKTIIQIGRFMIQRGTKNI
jgi:hypothetical protein